MELKILVENKLDYLEKKILQAIAETHPCNFQLVEYVYRRCASFDGTIAILQKATAHACDVNIILRLIKKQK